MTWSRRRNPAGEARTPTQPAPLASLANTVEPSGSVYSSCDSSCGHQVVETLGAGAGAGVWPPPPLPPRARAGVVATPAVTRPTANVVRRWRWDIEKLLFVGGSHHALAPVRPAIGPWS